MKKELYSLFFRISLKYICEKLVIKNNLYFILFSCILFSQQNDVIVDSFNLEEVFVSASKIERQLSSAPLNSIIIKEDEIQKFGSFRLDDILEEQNGLFIIPDPTVPGISGLQMQGLSSDYIQVLIDGVPIVGRLSGNLNLDRLNLNNIQRIEIVKGPSSSLFGSAAIGGVINLITKKDFKNKLKINLAQSVATNKSYDTDLILSKKIKKTDLSFSFNRYTTDGYDLGFNDGINTVDPYSNNSLTSTIKNQFNKSTSIILFNRFFKQKQISSNQKGIQEDVNSHLKFTKKFKNDLDSELEFYRTKFTNIEENYNSDNTFFDHRMEKIELRLFKRFNNLNSLVLGSSIENEYVSRSLFSNKVKSNLFNAFVQYDGKLLKKVNYVLGSRIDNHSDYKNNLSSKLSFKYYFNDKISLNASIGQGFKAPDFRQLYLNFSNSTSGYTVLGKYEEINGIENLRSNDNLLRLLINESKLGGVLIPEKSIGINVGIKFKLNKNLTTINYFRNDIVNLIDTRIIASKKNGQNVFGYVNIDEILTTGIELENNYNFSKDLDLKISYQLLFAYDKKNYQSVKDNKIFARDPITLESIVISKNKFIGLPNRSRHNINANIGYMDKYFLRLLVRSKYGVYDTNGNGFIDHYDSSIINNYLNINFSYNADLTKNLILNLTIKNLNNFKNESLLPNVFGREFIGRLTYSIN